MKKVYLIKAVDSREENPKAFIDEVFTNKKLAEAYVKYWKKEYRKGDYSYIVCLQEYEVCKCDFRSLAKLKY